MTKDPVQEDKCKSSARVFRGGSWRNSADRLVASYRRPSPGYRYPNLGFRVVRNAKEKP
jgi:formylglycine-generating enzyme required for sulfatase activity